MSGETSPNDPSATTPAYATPPAAVVTPAVPLPPENILRGFLFSLLALPAGVIVFTLIFSAGFIASIVGFGVAIAAYFLYKLGSGGRVSVRGALVVAAVTVGTLIIAFFVGEISSVAVALAQLQGRNWVEVISTPGFPAIAMGILTDPANMGNFLKDFALTMVFGIVGCFALLRGAFKEAKAGDAPVPAAGPTVTPPAA